jgi:hypothetical protein
VRSKATNILQIVILISGVVYIGIGLFGFIKPVNEDWLREMANDNFLFSIYNMSWGFSTLIMSAGLSMILPLFDPLRYRGLIYFTGIIFPFFYSLVLIRNMSITSEHLKGVKHLEGVSGGAAANDILIICIIMAAIFILTLVSLIITKNEAKSGIE